MWPEAPKYITWYHLILYIFLSLLQKDLIILNDIHRVFAVDALASSHPLSSKEDSVFLPEQITEYFDTISYSKVDRTVKGLTNRWSCACWPQVVEIPTFGQNCRNVLWLLLYWYLASMCVCLWPLRVQQCWGCCLTFSQRKSLFRD